MKYFIGILLFSLMLCRTGSAEIFSIGFRAGIPFADAVSGSGYKYWTWKPESKTYTIGPSVALRLTSRFSIEADALYRRIGYSRYGSYLWSYERVKTRADLWSFPVLARYDFGSRKTHPYIAAGLSYQHMWGAHSEIQAIESGTWLVAAEPQVFELQRSSNLGAVVAIGAQTRLWKLQLLPELRYIRWSSDLFSDPTGRDALSTNRNQVEFTIGFMLRRSHLK